MLLRPSRRRVLAALAVAFAAAPAALRPAAAQADTTGVAPPLLRIDGEVSARTLVHRTRPEVEVRFAGDLADTLAVDRREGLPRPVEPGVTYRDVRVYFTVRGALADSALAAPPPRPSAEGDRR